MFEIKLGAKQEGLLFFLLFRFVLATLANAISQEKSKSPVWELKKKTKT